MGEIGYHIQARGGKITSVATRWPDSVQHESIPAGLECMVCGRPRKLGDLFTDVAGVGECCELCREVLVELDAGGLMRAIDHALGVEPGTSERQIAKCNYSNGVCGE